MKKIIKEQSPDNSSDVFNKINNLKSWLSRSNGLGLQSVIGSMIESLKTNISDEEIQKYTTGADLLIIDFLTTYQIRIWFMLTVNGTPLTN